MSGKQYSVGDKVYICWNSGWGDTRFVSGSVIKITPSGLIDVQVTGSTIRFKNGHQLGERWHGAYIDDKMTLDQRREYIRKRNILHETAKLLKSYDCGLRSNYDEADIRQSLSIAETMVAECQSKLKEL